MSIENFFNELFPKQTYGFELNKVFCGDCLEVMKDFPEESIDLVVTDPPYGYGFMGKDWDKAVPSVEMWKECLRVLKSGAFAFVMSSPRQDVLSQMIVRLGLAGFETGFSSIYWAYASGFPKSENVSLQIDKRECLKQLCKKLGRKPTKEEFKEAWKTFRPSVGTRHRNVKPFDDANGWNKNDTSGDYVYTKAVTSEAQKLDGSFGGFQPKPAVEVIIVVMKPLSEKTFVDQALKNGKGVTWLDAARIPFNNEDVVPVMDRTNSPKFVGRTYNNGKVGEYRDIPYVASIKGRFPANLLVSDDVLNDGRTGYNDEGSFSRYFDLDKWFQKTVEGLPESVKKTFPFLICPKASKSERNQGCEELPIGKVEALHGNVSGVLNKRTNGIPSTARNIHPTVKPLELMSYLVTLGSRQKDVVLDPFSGSGTTCVASKLLGRNWIGIEINKDYCVISEERLAHLEAEIKEVEFEYKRGIEEIWT